ncbi:MAG: TraR/DksA C4-type zinc finger protein [Candidatus Limnocylindrales bacterium]|jgi:DnaK suppressor protein
MEPQLVENARRTLEAECARLRLELSEEVEHPRVAHGAQTAAATEVSESQRGQQLREREEQHLVLIEGALKRIEAGTFGLCQTCGKPIAPERLEALPWANDCVNCHGKKRR